MPATPRHRSNFKYLAPVTTRWGDNDIYGHVNNAVYYQYFDSAINHYLIREGGLDIHDGQVVGFIVHSACDYLRPVAYPGTLDVGVGTLKIGRSSVTYQVALFPPEADEPAAVGTMVHVFVDTRSNQPVPIPEPLRLAMERLALPA